jgi:hypothetical protein
MSSHSQSHSQSQTPDENHNHEQQQTAVEKESDAAEVKKMNGSLTITIFVRDTLSFPMGCREMMPGLDLKKDPKGIVLVVRREQYQPDTHEIPTFQSARLKSVHFHHHTQKLQRITPIRVQPQTSVNEIRERLSTFDNGFLTLQLVDVISEKNGEFFAMHNQAILFEPDQEPDLDIGITFGQVVKDKKRKLTIQSIQKSSWFAKSSLKQGELVLSINGKHCADLPPADATLFLQCKKESSSILSIETFPSGGRGGILKRTAVAVSGSVTIGVGAVIMATPLHPVGHAMTVGGLGILATEFEGPRNAFTKVKSRFSRKKSDGSSQENQHNGNAVLDQDEGIWRASSNDPSI